MGNSTDDTRRPRVAIETHGCKLNAADSQRMARELASAGYEVVEAFDEPDVYVLNSCTVTHVADRKARGALSAARRRHPAALVVAAGCYVERDRDAVAAVAGVDLVISNREKASAVELISQRLGRPAAPVPGYTRGAAMLGRTRASIKIQEGCNQVCAYCIVPTVRGRERSVPAREIAAQANEAYEGGCREIVLTGTQLGSYGFDLDGWDLASMLRALLAETDVPRIRVSSLQPQEITGGLLGVWDESEGRLCPHFHVPLQAGSDRVLRRMRRRYASEEFLAAIERVREAVPGAGVTTDVIAGFPGETDEDFEHTVDVMEAARFSDVHVFPYSVRPGTSAAHYGDRVPAQVRTERAARLRALGERDFRAFRDGMKGTSHSVLWERDRPAVGLTGNYVRVRLAAGASSGVARVNDIEEAVAMGFDGQVVEVISARNRVAALAKSRQNAGKMPSRAG